MRISPGDCVFPTDESLMLGNMPVNITGVASWRGVLPSFPATEQLPALKKNLTALYRLIKKNGRDGGLKRLIPHSTTDNSAEDIFSRNLRVRSTDLLRALERRNFAVADSVGRTLLGFGGGHTPSGDDFCAGLIAVMWLPSGPFAEEYRRFGLSLALEAKSLTTAISEALLRNAAAGRLREKIIDLLNELTGGTIHGTLVTGRQVLSIGSLSGTDLAVGIAAGMELGIVLREGGAERALWR